MSRISSDLRVRRTRKLLREALVSLVEERDFGDITVGEIAERAMVSRAAFYRSYQDKFDLVETMFTDMLAAVAREIDPLRHSVIDRLNAQPAVEPWAELFEFALEEQPTPAAFTQMFDYFAQHERLYQGLLARCGSPWFAARLRASLADTMRERLQALATALGSRQVAERRDFADGFVPSLLAAQLIDAISWWLEQGRPYTPAQIATYWFRLMCSTLRDMSAWA
jgi:AcrR family transcriptional regulator